MTEPPAGFVTVPESDDEDPVVALWRMETEARRSTAAHPNLTAPDAVILPLERPAR